MKILSAMKKNYSNLHLFWRLAQIVSKFKQFICKRAKLRVHYGNVRVEVILVKRNELQ